MIFDKALLRPLAIVALIALASALSGVSKAIQDTSQHHYATSVLTGWGSPQFWNAEISWQNKYRNFEAGDRRPAFPLATTGLAALTDAWHLFDTLRKYLLAAACFAAGLATARAPRPGRAGLFLLAAALVPASVAFHLFYTYILQ